MGVTFESIYEASDAKSSYCISDPLSYMRSGAPGDERSEDRRIMGRVTLCGAWHLYISREEPSDVEESRQSLVQSDA
jgi:hypothetical protein